MSNLEYKLFYSRHLPHIQPSGSILFITFRLANSLPISVIQDLYDEQLNYEIVLNKITNPELRKIKAYDHRKIMFGKWDDSLNQQICGPSWLREENIAEIVAGALHFGDQKYFQLICFCIMPNHVHLLCKPLDISTGAPYPIAKFMHSIKSFTANQCNRELNREGEFWQHENYDHIVRNDQELRKICEYIIFNPVKANLIDTEDKWKWNYLAYPSD